MDEKRAYIHTGLLRNVSMNTLQILSNQVLGVFIFLLLSRYLDKISYGELNWALAVLTLATTILSFRLEQIVVRDIAAGKDAGHLLTLFIVHTVGAALLLLGVLAAGYYFFDLPPLLWWFSFSQVLLLIALPFRQLVTGKSAFGWLALLASVSNIIRCLGLLAFVCFSALTMEVVLILFTVSALAEWVVGVIVVFIRLGVPLVWKAGWVALVRDSFPQLGLVFLNAGMARIDWVLMGVWGEPGKVAEYSFSYRAYEFSPFPLLVLAPFLLNSCARRVAGGVFTPPSWLKDYIRAALVLGTLLPLLGVLAWTPVVDWLTMNKYGRTGMLPFLLLSCSIPFQYLINVHWSIEFAKNRLGHIFRVTAITALVVVAGDLAAIPFYGGVGAAAVWLVSMIVQYSLYERNWNKRLLLAIGIAVLAGGVAIAATSSLPLRLAFAVGIYILGAWVTGLVRVKDIPEVWMVYLRRIDWGLFFFLVGMLNVKLYVKVAAIVFALVLFRRTAVTRDVFRQRFLWFYAVMILLAIVNFLIAFSFSPAGLVAFALGGGYWLLALLAGYFVYQFVRRGELERIHRTVGLFFLANAAGIVVSFLSICIESGSINPYTYEGMHRHYFINTGDMITSIGLDGSVTTSLIGAFGVLYFLYRNRYGAMLFCMATVLLAGSNFIDMMLAAVFVFIFIFRTTRIQKSLIVVSLLFMAVFWAKVSPQNGIYVQEILKRVDKKNVYVEPVPIPNAKMTEFVEKKEVVHKEEVMKSFEQTLYSPKMEDSFRRKYKNFNRSGRLVSLQQMAGFFGKHPELLPLGAGMGNFSSRLAFKTTALDIDGGYPVAKRYIHPFFRDNYLWLYLYYHSRDEGQHSVVNKPDSVYGQLLSEYGVVGVAAFILLYAGFFFWRSGRLTYGLSVLLLMGMAFFTEYWFEQLSIVILFELLLLLDQRANLNTDT
ncbi:MAG: oligosaccharide flippase family protein [Bacteroidetes bacterium]|nr:oligosaccharide flippase family protein [Bacteroidota bacterium]